MSCDISHIVKRTASLKSKTSFNLEQAWYVGSLKTPGGELNPVFGLVIRLKWWVLTKNATSTSVVTCMALENSRAYISTLHWLGNDWITMIRIKDVIKRWGRRWNWIREVIRRWRRRWWNRGQRKGGENKEEYEKLWQCVTHLPRGGSIRLVVLSVHLGGRWTRRRPQRNSM